MSDTLTSTLSYYGRVVDELSREPAHPRDFKVSLESDPAEAEYKSDGHFAFGKLRRASTTRVLRMDSAIYQTRRFSQAPDADEPLELAYPGEDELYLAVLGVNGTQVTFEAVPFLSRIRKGAAVHSNGVSTTLDADLGGADVTSALLKSTAGIAKGHLLRIVRSNSLLAKAGPYFPFSAGLTLAHLRCAEASGAPDSLAGSPLAGVRLRLKKANGIAPSGTKVAELTLHEVTIPGPPVRTLVLGQERDLEATTDQRGRAVFYFPEHWSITSLEIEASLPGFSTRTLSLTLAKGMTLATSITLTAS